MLFENNKSISNLLFGNPAPPAPPPPPPWTYLENQLCGHSLRGVLPILGYVVGGAAAPQRVTLAPTMWAGPGGGGAPVSLSLRISLVLTICIQMNYANYLHCHSDLPSASGFLFLTLLLSRSLGISDILLLFHL